MWIKKDKAKKSLREVMEANTGIDAEELMRPTPVDPSCISNLEKAAEKIVETIKAGVHITIFGDYDADGVTSTLILTELFQALGGNVSYRLPRRLSEGYGISAKAVSEIESGLLVTVDNGIAALEEIKAAKEKGLTVIIIDHHLPKDELPCADIIVDPHVYHDKFEDYCGAGLSLKLEELFYRKEMISPTVFHRHLVYAAIGTVADVMPLVSDNRLIVQRGLTVMRHYGRVLSPSFAFLLQELGGSQFITSTDIGFRIGPIINAAGRLLDDGAQAVVTAFMEANPDIYTEQIQSLIALNEQRKSLVKQTVEQAKAEIEGSHMNERAPLVLYMKDVPEGIVGIIAGRLAEDYRMPAFVLTNSGDIYKGSARSFGDYDLSILLNGIEKDVIRAGGHKGAAGLSVQPENFEAMKMTMYELMKDYHNVQDETIFYDMKIPASKIPQIAKELEAFEPFGEGVPAPKFLIEDAVLSPKSGAYYALMGKSREHVKLFGNGFSAVAFGMAEKYVMLNTPAVISAIGTLSQNHYRGKTEFQIEMEDFKEGNYEKFRSGKRKIVLPAAL